ncbi:MAG: 50S ribosomal protein P1 [Promethearchaeota archaeon]|nr:MAG: 50S ribosomal protein P1 [Candidatus Lokiarchaeota archaeon]
MESIYAALLLHKAAKNITEDNIEKILKAADIKPDNAQITKLVSGLKETDIEEILKSAASVPAAAVPATSEAPAGEEKAEKEQKKEEEEEEDEEPAGIGSLF